MIGPLVRWFGAGSGPAGRGGGPAVRFTPRLDELGARITPASRPSAGGDINPGQVAVAADVGVASLPDDGGSKPDGTGEGVSDAGVAHGAWVGGPSDVVLTSATQNESRRFQTLNVIQDPPTLPDHFRPGDVTPLGKATPILFGHSAGGGVTTFSKATPVVFGHQAGGDGLPGLPSESVSLNGR